MYEVRQCLIKENNRQEVRVWSTNGSRRIGAALDEQDTLLGEQISLLVYAPKSEIESSLLAYGEYLSSLLQGQITRLSNDAGESRAKFNRISGDFDLVLVGQPDQSALEKFLNGPFGHRVASRVQTTILLASKPRWPIRKILLVLRVEACEETAVDWAGRLSRFSGAKLTILPLVPSQPMIFGSSSHLQAGIGSLLTSETPCGQQLRIFLNRLGKWHITGKLRARQGDPLWQICWEIQEGKYDLVVASADHRSLWRRWLFGQIIGPLLSRVNVPILIAGPRQMCSNPAER